MRKQVEEWLHFAEIDLLSARKLLEDAYLTQSAAFHIHQSVEKCFKALIEDLNLRVPKIHDLEKLLGIIIEHDIILKTNTEIISMINDVYIETRYPNDQGLIPEGIPSIEFIQEIYSFAETLYKEIYQLLNKESAL